VRQAEKPRGPYREALRSGEFRAIFLATAITITGSSVSAVALTVLVYERTGSPFLSSLTFALGFLPYLVGGTLLSGLVDRVPPRRLLVTLDLCAMVLTATMALPGMPIPGLLAMLFATSTLTSLSTGTRGGLVRAIVSADSYVPARSLLRITGQTAQIAGNAVGGVLLVALSPRGAILVNAASFLLSACVMRLGLRVHAVAEPGERTALLRDSLRGVRQIFANVELRRLLLLGWLVPMCAVAPESVAAPYVAGQGASPAFVGLWLGALPVGIIAGDLIAVWGIGADRLRRLVGLAAAASLVPYLIFVGRPPLEVAIPLLVLAGMGGMWSLGVDALVRDVAPERGFGRMMTLNTAGLMTAQGLGFALAGALAEAVGAGGAIASAGLCGLVFVLFLRPRGVQAAPAMRERGGGRITPAPAAFP
jgi:MFS family permease